MPVDRLLDDAEKYWAHKPSFVDFKKPETLKETNYTKYKKFRMLRRLNVRKY